MNRSAAARRAGTAVRFSPVAEVLAGVRIGVPLKLLPKIGAPTRGSRRQVVFDRNGALLGLVPAAPTPEKRIGGVAPPVPRPMIDAAALAGFLGSNRPKETEKSATVERSLGDIVAENRGAVVAVYCAP